MLINEIRDRIENVKFEIEKSEMLLSETFRQYFEVAELNLDSNDDFVHSCSRDVVESYKLWRNMLDIAWDKMIWSFRDLEALQDQIEGEIEADFKMKKTAAPADQSKATV